MKKILLLTLILLGIQTVVAQDKYDKFWSKVEQYELQGKFKSASEVVDKIFKKAKRSKESSQIAKSFIYKSKFALLLEENAQLNIVAEIEEHINNSDFPTNAILESVYAGFLQQYLEKNRHRIRQRTKIPFSNLSDDFEKWDIDTFVVQIARHYKNSISREIELKQLPIEDFETILTHSRTSTKYRPTLYDFLVHRSIDYHKVGRLYNTRPKERFYISDPVVFESTSDFSRENFYTVDSIYSKRIVLKLYQKLEIFHEISDTTAYIDVMLERLKFSKANSTLKNKDSLYFKALKRMAQKFRKNETSSVIHYQIADFYFQASKRNDAKKDPLLRNYRIKSRSICKKVIKEFPNSDGGLLCKILKNKIEDQTLTITSEKYVVPDKPFLGRVVFKSVDSLYLSIYKIPYNYFEKKYSLVRDSLALERIEENDPIISRFYELQPKKDFYEYSTEIDLPGISEGSYLIVASNGKEIKSLDQIYGYDLVTASKLSILSINKDKYVVLRLLNRDNGKPIKNVNITINDEKNLIKSGKTNDFGEFYIEKDDKYRYDVRIIASHMGDTLLNSYYYLQGVNSQFDDEGEHIAKMMLFLDRSIYRPGQTVYFKGLLFDKKNGESNVVPNIYTYVAIYDANGDELKEFRLKTNEFGSISGEYKIPSNILTGEFYIEMDEDYGDDDNDEDPYWEKVDDVEYVEVDFSVEEYKRPKFEVVFDEITENYRVGDSINVIGNAKAFLGSNVSDAKVTYSISRRISSSLTRSYYYGSSQIIITGETTTDDNGRFNIKFIAESDSLSVKKDKPVFSYTLKANITDINGETQSNEKNIYIGYHNLKIDVLMANKLESNQPQSIRINTENLNGQPISSDVELSIYKLSEPDRVLRKKRWEMVELHSIPKNIFLKLFPNEVYDSTDLPQNWPKKARTFFKSLNTSNANSVTLDSISQWEPGAYILEAIAIDAFKDTISLKKRFEIYNPDGTYIVKSKLFDYEVMNSQFKADKQVSLKLKTSAKNLIVTMEGYYKGEEIYKKTVTIESGSTITNIPIHGFYKDKIDINLSFVKFNSLYTNQFTVNFPETEKELTIETLSFRNKLIPDQKETWSFKITDSDGKNTQAEILASMYDASLDKFKEHNWNTDIGFENYYYSRAPGVQSDGFFGTTTLKLFERYRINNISSVLKNYHKLKWFGLNFGNTTYQNRKYLNYLTLKIEQDEYVEGNISGIITDSDGLPIPGVNVIVKGTSIGTQTDFDGYYSINAPVGSKIVYSYLGYTTEEVTVGKSGVINLAMTEDSEALSEVVVTAYGGTPKIKKALGYAVSYVTAENVSEDIIGKLGGLLAGVQIVGSSGASGSGTNFIIRSKSSINGNNQPLFIVDGVPMNLDGNSGFEFSLFPGDIQSIDVLKGLAAATLYGMRGNNGVVIITTKKGLEALTQVETRSDLKENAFFFPHLTTNKDGEVTFSFSSPQALTKWRFMLLAHNKNLEIGVLEKIAVTQKDLNIIPNTPRFLREKDTIIISAKISNLTSETLSGSSLLQLFDAMTMNPIDKELMNIESTKSFNISPKGNSTVSWKLVIPQGLEALQYKIIAKSGTHSDGETSVLPVLSNRILLTEAKALWVQSGKTKSIVFEKLKTKSSSTLNNHRFTLEYTSNPAWLAILSLPYLMEFLHECSEQTFARFYSNTLAASIVNNNPKVKAVFDSWKSKGPLESVLEKNEKLKSILISESPWVRDALSEKENKSRLANLFDEEKVKDQQIQTINKLKELQLSSGGFPWFSGGRESAFITRHIVTGFGHLQKLNIQNKYEYKIKPILKKAIGYLDSEFIKDYSSKIQKTSDSSNISLNHNTIQYLYARSFYLETHPVSKSLNRIIEIYIQKYNESWLTRTLYDKGMMALFLYRMNEGKTAKAIIDALKEQAVHSEENGMYWKENTSSWYWYKAPIETQSLLIEAFSEIENDNKTIDKLKLWLLKNKRTNRWNTTKATTEAVYAMLMNGSDWLSVSDNTVITIGNDKIKTNKLKSIEKEAGSGYMKIDWSENEIKAEMASVKITNKSKVTGYGGVYWQYFEDLDKITTSGETPLRIRKEIFLKKITDGGDVLTPIKLGTPIEIGDLVTIRMEITSISDMEFVHLKDLRASGLEPIDVLSEYKWQDGLGYYQSTKDVATHFFFDRLPTGTYIFEYNLRANNSGNFSNGITTIQSMYAPEFTDHSKGIRININE
jgi:TonB-dependent SusC/RagA subfamily outer membrane receptor